MSDWHHVGRAWHEPHEAEPDMARIYISRVDGHREAPCLHPDCRAVHEAVAESSSRYGSTPTEGHDE